MKPEYQNRVLEALNSKMPNGPGACPLCGTRKWTFLDGFVLFSIQDAPGGTVKIGGEIAPSVGLICTTCGNTQFINILILGLNDIVEKAKAEEQESPFWRAQRREESKKK